MKGGRGELRGPAQVILEGRLRGGPGLWFYQQDRRAGGREGRWLPGPEDALEIPDRVWVQSCFALPDRSAGRSEGPPSRPGDQRLGSQPRRALVIQEIPDSGHLGRDQQAPHRGGFQRLRT
ncbi:UNVERIFIED_CONTAM: hypothetical protein FKN15_074908 [Acipenser sinensis]